MNENESEKPTILGNPNILEIPSLYLTKIPIEDIQKIAAHLEGKDIASYGQMLLQFLMSLRDELQRRGCLPADDSVKGPQKMRIPWPMTMADVAYGLQLFNGLLIDLPDLSGETVQFFARVNVAIAWGVRFIVSPTGELSRN